MKTDNYREWQKPNPKRNKYIYKLHLTGKYSYPQIADKAFEKFGTKITPDRVRQIIERQKQLACG